MEKFCECGCGGLTKTRFISEHNTTRGETEIREGKPWKKCQQCTIWQEVETGFYPKKNSTWGNNPCKACLKQYREENSEKIKARERLRRFKNHGHDEQYFIDMWEEQNRACAICKIDYELDDLTIDHDHYCCPGNSLVDSA